jgi:integrase/recombinase XerC
MADTPTVTNTIQTFLSSLENVKSSNTIRVYRNALQNFIQSIIDQGVDPSKLPAELVSEDWYSNYIKNISYLALSTQKAYIQGIVNWYQYLHLELNITIDINRIKLLSRSLRNKPLRKIQQSPPYFEISRIIEYIQNVGDFSFTEKDEKLRFLRDRVVIFLLVDTNFESSELCESVKADLDFKNGQISRNPRGKRNQSSKLSRRTVTALREYFIARNELDKLSGRSPNTLPILARHDRGAGKKLKPITTKTITNIIKFRAEEALGYQPQDPITPIVFRHYRSSTILQMFDLLHPKIVERCYSLFEGGHFDAAISAAMLVIEEEVRDRAQLTQSDHGRPLIAKALANNPIISFSTDMNEQESAFFLFSGALGYYKNPRSHRFLNTSDPIRTLECISLASLLLKMLDESEYRGNQ